MFTGYGPVPPRTAAPSQQFAPLCFDSDSAIHTFTQIAETVWGTPYHSLLGLQARLNECLPQIRCALLIAQLAALLRWKVFDEALCHQVLQVPAQSLFRDPDVFGNVC